MTRNLLFTLFIFFISFANAQHTNDCLNENVTNTNNTTEIAINFNEINCTSIALIDTPYKKQKVSFFENETKFNGLRFYGLAGTTLFSLAGSYLYVDNAWWANGKRTFRFDGGANIKDIFSFGSDAIYAKGLDKLGHLYGGILAGELFADGAKWSGKSQKASYLWGGVFGSAVQCFIEVKDGFSPTWGFSIYDLMAGSLGSFYPYFQSKNKFLHALDVKFSYARRNDYYFASRERIANVTNAQFIDDYMNQTYWFTFNPKRYKPESKWPKWLGVSLGMGVDDRLNYYYRNTGAVSNDDIGHGGYEVFFAPDIDFIGLLPKKPFWHRVGKLLNYIKFPAPTLRLSNNSKFFLLYF